MHHAINNLYSNSCIQTSEFYHGDSCDIHDKEQQDQEQDIPVQNMEQADDPRYVEGNVKPLNLDLQLNCVINEVAEILSTHAKQCSQWKEERQFLENETCSVKIFEGRTNSNRYPSGLLEDNTNVIWIQEH